MSLSLKRCDCGQMPKVIPERVAEDCYETYVACGCGIHGDEVEHPYPDHETAIWNWNEGQRRPRP